MNRFITFEGIEGTGKSTQTKLLAKSFNNSNINYVCTREPGGTDIAEQIRKIIVSSDTENIDGVTELLLIEAARNEHVIKKIKPALDDKYFVICDRFTDSTLAYQGYGHKINLDIFNQKKNINNISPAVTFILDMDITQALSRTLTRNNKEDKFEKMPIEFHLRVQQGFREIYKNNKDRCVNIDANKDIIEIHKSIIDHINNKFHLNLNYIDIS